MNTLLLLAIFINYTLGSDKMIQIVLYQSQYEPQLKELLRGFEAEVEHRLRWPFPSAEISPFDDPESLDENDQDDELMEMVEEGAEDALSQINQGNDDCYLALSPEGNVIGFQVTHLYHNQADKHVKAGDLELSRLYVHPDSRKKGIARMLNQHCLERGKEVEGINRAISFVEKSNSPNIALKRDLGFRKSTGYQDGARVYHFFQKLI